MKKTGRKRHNSRVKKVKHLRNIVFIALGSNKGNRINYLRRAVSELTHDSKLKVVASSSVYETKPFGDVNQADFLNAVIKVKTSYLLIEMFDFLKQLEVELGRRESTKWGPREIDLDLLFFNDFIFNNEKLTVPHFGIQDRDFVLVPLKEIASEYFHPALKKKISDICIEDIPQTVIRKTRYRII